MKSYKFLNVFLILITLFLQGCGTTIKMETIPELKTGSPLSGIKPLTFFIASFRNEVGEVVGISPNYGPIKMDTPANQLFSDAFAAELKRNGHTVLLNNDNRKADIILDGKATRYWLDRRHNFWSGTKYYVIAEAELTLATSRNEKISKIYKGSFECGNLLNPNLFKTEWKNCLYETLLSMVNDFSTDKDLVDFLKRQEKVKYG